ncbi:MAG: DUF885 family protein, partial [Phenylobacterium sp.]
MRLSRRRFGVALAGAAALPSVAMAQARDPSAALTAYLDAEFEKELAMDPEALTGLGRKQLYDQLADRSEAAGDRALAWRRRSVADMKARFDPAKLNDDARTSYEMWALELERAEADAKWRRHAYIFDRSGAHTRLPNFMINFHKVDTASDMDAYIARVAAIGRVLDQLLARARLSAALGVHMPGFAYDQSLAEIARLTSGAPF